MKVKHPTLVGKLITLSSFALVSIFTAIKPASSQSVFTQQVTRPIGITTDAAGDILVQTDKVFDHGVAIFRSDGSLLSYIPIGGFADIEGLGYLATRTSDGLILQVGSNGTVRVIDPVKGKSTDVFSLRSLSTDASSVYDVALGQISNLSGTILPSNSTFGDIAILSRPGNVTDIFITGLSQAQIYPFVMRVRLNAQGVITSSKVIAASSVPGTGNTKGSFNSTRGIAVNAQGLVATTLPVPAGNGTSFDRVIAFSADFPETGTGRPQVKLNGLNMYSKGMTTDPAGNYYIATGPVGTSIAGTGGSGALVILSPDLSKVTGIKTINQPIVDSCDVTVRNGKAYMALFNFDAVVSFPVP